MKTFKETYEGFKNDKTDAEIADRANLSRTTLAHLIQESIRAKRNLLWSLCSALELNLAQSKELFSSASLCMDSSYHLSNQEKEREKFLRECIVKEEYDVAKLNGKLAEKGYQLLGNRKKNSQ